MKILLTILISVVFFSLSSSSILQNSAFAQMESMRISGYQYPEINSVFNVNIVVDGISRASGGLFDVQLTIYQKDKPTWVVQEGVRDLYSGPNTVKIDLKKGKPNPFIAGVQYILEVQHTYIVTEFEFVPVDKSSGVTPPTIETKTSVSPLEKLVCENKELKKQLEDKDAIIMEQIKVIQNLASMIKNTVFVPILNYFDIF